MKKVRRGRTPDLCPAHPESRTFISTDSNGDRTREHAIVQHTCGEPGCEEPLGWEFRGPRGEFRSGPQRPPPELLHAIKMEKHDEKTVNIIGSTVITTLSLFFLALIVQNAIMETEWETYHTAAASVCLPTLTAAMYYVKRVRDRTRPTAHERQDSGDGANNPATH